MSGSLQTELKITVVSTLYQHFTQFFMSVPVEYVTGMKRTHTTGEGQSFSCALSNQKSIHIAQNHNHTVSVSFTISRVSDTLGP